MKKTILAIVIAFVFVITLLIAPLGLSADVETKSYSITFFVPDAGITKDWTNPTGEAIKKVTILYKKISDGSSFLMTFLEDGSNSAAGVIGIGTPDIKIITSGGTSDDYNAIVTFYYDKWIRDHQMVCKTVWVNEDNNFEFIFDYYYAKNNWVKIYDMDGNMVWETNFAYGKNRFVAELPDGMYTVKTFHDDMDTPIQEFVIGKP